VTHFLFIKKPDNARGAIVRSIENIILLHYIDTGEEDVCLPCILPLFIKPSY
jgi:hypothetical protein